MGLLKFTLSEEAIDKGALYRILWFGPPEEGDVGWDLRYVGEDIMLLPGDHVLLSTGVSIETPYMCFGLIKDRSSMAKKGLFVAAGVIDPGYRGEIKVDLRRESRGWISVPIIQKILLKVFGRKRFSVLITPGDKIAQLIVVPYAMPSAKLVDELSDTKRGAGGWGSTGR